mgnify:FL=1
MNCSSKGSMKLLYDIQESCNRRLQQMGFTAESYLLPGGLGIKFKGQPPSNLHDLYELPIIECDLSVLENFDLQSLNPEKISSLVLPHKTKIPFTELSSFNLVRLKAFATASTDFEKLAGHPLEILELPNSSLQDIRFCEKMPLRILNLAGAQISRFHPLKKAKLTILNLFKTRIEEMNELNCESMEEIVLSGSPISNISFLTEANKLRKVEIRGTPVNDLSPLANCPIEELHLPGSHVKSIDCLAYLPIKTLNIIGIVLKDIHCLSTLPLKSLAISPEVLRKEDYEFLANLNIQFLRGPGDPPAQTAEEFFYKHTNPSVLE